MRNNTPHWWAMYRLFYRIALSTEVHAFQDEPRHRLNFEEKAPHINLH